MAALAALTARQIKLQLPGIPDWSKHAKIIQRTFKFEDFLRSLAFVNRIAKRAQKLNHRPDIDIRYDKVTLTLTTHDAGGLTEKDFTLARHCDEVFSRFFVS